MAVVFLTRYEDGNTVNEGICLKCAKELGIKPVNDIMEKMGISDEDLDRMDMELENLMQIDENNTDDESSDNAGKIQPIDFKKIFGEIEMSGQDNLPFSHEPIKGGEKNTSETKNSTSNGKRPKKKFLDMYCQDLTKKAAEGKIDTIVGREREILRLTQILCRRQKNNPCLIGEPGVGKTAIAEALALKIVHGDVPYKLKDKEIHLVDLTALVAGTQFRGQFETRIKGLIDEVKALGNIILVIDEIHSIVGAGDAEGGMNAANILKPSLSRGEIQVIGATTLAEYRKYIEKDAALERRFQPIIIEEPSIEESIKILMGIKHYYESYHGIKIPDETVRKTVLLSERYITERFLPDKAIDLLDEAASYLSLKSPLINELGRINDEIKETVRKREELEENVDTKEVVPAEEKYKLIADLKSKELSFRKRYDELSKEKEKIELTVADLAKVIEIWTGIPASNITELEYEKIDKLTEKIKSRIVGQDQAVDSVVRAIKRNRAGIAYKRKPVSFIFAGPTGVGKTELVKTLANELFDSPETLIRLDMSEFMEKHSVSRIIGAPPGYVGYDDAGQLTEKIRRKPYSVILFDEIEKAHPDVLNILLQILDDGRITDAQGRQINFENTIIIMTTNAGSDRSYNLAGFSANQNLLNEEKTMKALTSFLRPEFINRVDEVITFRSLDENDFVQIAKIMLNDLVKTLAEKGIKVAYNEDAAKYIARKSFDTKFGARNMRRFIQKNVEDEIANIIISSYEKGIEYVGIGYDSVNDKLDIQCR